VGSPVWSETKTGAVRWGPRAEQSGAWGKDERSKKQTLAYNKAQGLFFASI